MCKSVESFTHVHNFWPGTRGPWTLLTLPTPWLRHCRADDATRRRFFAPPSAADADTNSSPVTGTSGSTDDATTARNRRRKRSAYVLKVAEQGAAAGFDQFVTVRRTAAPQSGRMQAVSAPRRSGGRHARPRHLPGSTWGARARPRRIPTAVAPAMVSANRKARRPDG